MRHLLLAVVLLALAGSGPAHADGFYFSEGFGGGEVAGPMARFYQGGFTGRAAIGRHVGEWAFAARIAGTSLSGVGPFSGRDYSAFSYGVEARRLVRLSAWAQAYVRGGIGHMNLDTTFGEDSRGGDYHGRSLDIGAGLQVGGHVPVVALLYPPLVFCEPCRKLGSVSAGLWLDLGHEAVRLERSRATTLGGALDTVTIGFNLGGNF